MARASLEGWMTEEKSSKVMTTIAQTSAVEALARHEPMKYNIKSFNRSGDVDVEIVAKGSAYGEDNSTNDDIELKAFKFGKAIRVAEEDLDDSPTNFVDTKKASWASSYAKLFDNACLGTTAAVGAGVPFTSIYRALATADATTGYVANANIVKTAGALKYDHLVDGAGIVEEGDYYDDSNSFIIAHPAVKRVLRKMKDDQGRLIYQPGSAADSTPETLWGSPVKWSRGARTSAVATKAPTGNPLIIFGNRDLMIVGDRSGPESVIIDGKDGLSALTDETIVKMRARKAFGIGYPQAFSIIEITAA